MARTAGDSEIAEQTLAVVSRVKRLMGWNDATIVLWLGAKNPNLGNVTPASMIISGRTERLMQFIAEAEAAQRR